MHTTALALSLLAAAAAAQAPSWTTLDGPIAAGRGFVHDTVRSRGVMVDLDGGTWEWDGSRWLHRPTGAALFGRVRVAMAFDSVRGHTLLFGGLLPNAAVVSDTWTWNGCEWRQPFSALTPSRRAGAAMTFDSARGRVVMYGGTDPARGVFLRAAARGAHAAAHG